MSEDNSCASPDGRAPPAVAGRVGRGPAGPHEGGGAQRRAPGAPGGRDRPLERLAGRPADLLPAPPAHEAAARSADTAPTARSRASSSPCRRAALCESAAGRRRSAHRRSLRYGQQAEAGPHDVAPDGRKEAARPRCRPHSAMAPTIGWFGLQAVAGVVGCRVLGRSRGATPVHAERRWGWAPARRPSRRRMRGVISHSPSFVRQLVGELLYGYAA